LKSTVSQIGRTVELFDWSGVAPTGTFEVVIPYTWNLSKLYTTGEVTLTAVPEPTPLLLLAILAASIGCMRRGGCANRVPATH